MIFRRTFQLPCIDETVEQRVVEFWRRRGVELRRVDQCTWRGRRGYFWGVFAPFDPTRWPARVHVSAASDNTISCLLHYGDTWVTFTEWTRSIPDIELAALENHLLTGNGEDATVKSAVQAARARSWEWVRRSWLGIRGPRHLKQRNGIQVVVLAWAICLSALAGGMAGLSAYSYWYWHAPRTSEPMPSPYAIAFVECRPWIAATAILVALAALLVRMRRHARRCLSAEQVAAQFGSTPEEAQRALAERGVKPRFIVDGLPVYDPAHVTDAGQLLRPADPPAGETLLRPASSGEQADPAKLLRPVGNDAAAVSRATQSADEAVTQEAAR